MTTQKQKVELKRVNINLPINLVKRVEDYSESIGVNTTSAYIYLLNQALNQNKQISAIPSLLAFFKAYENIDNSDFNNSFTDVIKDSEKMTAILEEIEKND